MSATLGLCELCAYRREQGDAAAERQHQAAEADRARRKRPKVKRP